MNFKTQKITVKLSCMKIKFLSAFIVVFLFQTNSYAYLDPGSTNIIIQILATLGIAIASVYLSIKLKIKELIDKTKKIFSKKKK
jgi:hypothetical protein